MYKITVTLDPGFPVPAEVQTKTEANRLSRFVEDRGGGITFEKIASREPRPKMMERSILEDMARMSPIPIVRDLAKSIVTNEFEPFAKWFTKIKELNAIQPEDDEAASMLVRILAMPGTAQLCLMEAISRLLSDPELVDFINERKP